jgi:hypothetical protein
MIFNFSSQCRPLMGKYAKNFFCVGKIDLPYSLLVSLTSRT